MPERISERHSLNDTYIQRIFQISGLLKIDHNKYGTAKYNASLIYDTGCTSGTRGLQETERAHMQRHPSPW